MTRNTAKGSRAAARRESKETETTRFEFARRHVIQGDKLEEKRDEAWAAMYNWLRSTSDGGRRVATDPDRKPRTVEERAEWKVLENAYIDARARVMLHENDGMYL